MRETQMLKEGKVGVLSTDTLYGLVAVATNEEAVKRVYALKRRAPTKPCIILIASLGDLATFHIKLTEEQKAIIQTYWPGPTSIVLACDDSVPEYLHCGTRTLAFRLPADARLQELLRESGSLIAPSANPESLPPATTVAEARGYFGDAVDFYLDGGALSGAPSTLISINEHGEVIVIRKGRS